MDTTGLSWIQLCTSIHTVDSSRVPRSLERRLSLVEGCNGLPHCKDIPPGDTLKQMPTICKNNEQVCYLNEIS